MTPTSRIKRRRALIALASGIALLLLALWHSPRRNISPTARLSPAPEAVAVSTASPSVRTAAPRALQATETPSAEALASKSIAAIADVIRAHIASSPRFAQLASCDPNVDDACRALLSQAIYEAMDVKVLSQTLRGGLGLKQLSKHDADAIYASVGRVLSESKDGVERSSALMLLSSVRSLPLRALPEAAYRDLSERTIAEAQLTLLHPVGGPIPYPDVPRELLSLFSEDRDPRLQDTALIALAHPETEGELLAAVRETARHHGSDWPDWHASVGPAVARCGMACLQTIDAVLDASGDDPNVAEEMLRGLREAERVPFTEHLKDRFEPKALLALATSAGVELPSMQ
jgi:hypothetical protein